MRVPDRFWWVERTAGILVAVVGAGLAVWIFWDLNWNFPIVKGDPVFAKLRAEEILYGCSAVLIALQGVFEVARSAPPLPAPDCRH
jgi:hypothetical protein